jgi:hypothetical protein
LTLSERLEICLLPGERPNFEFLRFERLVRESIDSECLLNFSLHAHDLLLAVLMSNGRPLTTIVSHHLLLITVECLLVNLIFLGQFVDLDYNAHLVASTLVDYLCEASGDNLVKVIIGQVQPLDQLISIDLDRLVVSQGGLLRFYQLALQLLDLRSLP